MKRPVWGSQRRDRRQRPWRLALQHRAPGHNRLVGALGVQAIIAGSSNAPASISWIMLVWMAPISACTEPAARYLSNDAPNGFD